MLPLEESFRLDRNRSSDSLLRCAPSLSRFFACLCCFTKLTMVRIRFHDCPALVVSCGLLMDALRVSDALFFSGAGVLPEPPADASPVAEVLPGVTMLLDRRIMMLSVVARRRVTVPSSASSLPSVLPPFSSPRALLLAVVVERGGGFSDPVELFSAAGVGAVLPSVSAAADVSFASAFVLLVEVSPRCCSPGGNNGVATSSSNPFTVLKRTPREGPTSTHTRPHTKQSSSRWVCEYVCVCVCEHTGEHVPTHVSPQKLCFAVVC